jgi:hypothetical protein
MKRDGGGGVVLPILYERDSGMPKARVGAVSDCHGSWFALVLVFPGGSVDGLGGKGVHGVPEVGEWLIAELVAVGPEGRLGSGTVRGTRKAATGRRWRDEEGAWRCEAAHAGGGALEAVRPHWREVLGILPLGLPDEQCLCPIEGGVGAGYCTLSLLPVALHGQRSACMRHMTMRGFAACVLGAWDGTWRLAPGACARRLDGC